MCFRCLVTKALMWSPMRTKESTLIPLGSLTTTFSADPPLFCKSCPPAGTSAKLFRPSCHNVAGMERECHSTHAHAPFPPQGQRTAIGEGKMVGWGTGVCGAAAGICFEQPQKPPQSTPAAAAELEPHMVQCSCCVQHVAQCSCCV